MNDVELRYKDDIRNALRTANVEELISLIPDISEGKAEECIKEYESLYLDLMDKKQNNLNVLDVTTKIDSLLKSLLNHGNSSEYRK